MRITKEKRSRSRTLSEDDYFIEVQQVAAAICQASQARIHLQGKEASEQQPPPGFFQVEVPLIGPSGHSFGTLSVLDPHPLSLSAKQQRALEIIAKQVVAKLESRQPVAEGRLSTIGEMAASIAHEINNPLTIINGNVVLLKRALRDSAMSGPKALAQLETIEKTVHRVDKIIRGMRSLSRENSCDLFEEIHLASLVESAILCLREKFQIYGVQIRERQPKLLAKAACQPIQVEQILINLLNNAFDAVQNLSEKWVEIDIQSEGSYWKISVTDSGHGIPSELRDKIMQPFFTTKDLQLGTGLGLSISKAIAEQHNGFLELDTQSKNTCFVLRLPQTKS